ncbi:hypothetical protein V5E97_19250 [Singulisphaera sp. Ch08]|uniref:Uncharacterized protein n=1 Tax=Singulisphaera sp. Ch08 TaxID=3120278 RepID=A0AAU7CR68_9BACT
MDFTPAVLGPLAFCSLGGNPQLSRISSTIAFDGGIDTTSWTEI